MSFLMIKLTEWMSNNQIIISFIQIDYFEVFLYMCSQPSQMQTPMGGDIFVLHKVS